MGIQSSLLGAAGSVASAVNTGVALKQQKERNELEKIKQERQLAWHEQRQNRLDKQLDIEIKEKEDRRNERIQSSNDTFNAFTGSLKKKEAEGVQADFEKLKQDRIAKGYAEADAVMHAQQQAMKNYRIASDNKVATKINREKIKQAILKTEQEQAKADKAEAEARKKNSLADRTESITQKEINKAPVQLSQEPEEAIIAPAAPVEEHLENQIMGDATLSTQKAQDFKMATAEQKDMLLGQAEASKPTIGQAVEPEPEPEIEEPIENTSSPESFPENNINNQVEEEQSGEQGKSIEDEEPETYKQWKYYQQVMKDYETKKTQSSIDENIYKNSDSYYAEQKKTWKPKKPDANASDEIKEQYKKDLADYKQKLIDLEARIENNKQKYLAGRITEEDTANMLEAEEKIKQLRWHPDTVEYIGKKEHERAMIEGVEYAKKHAEDDAKKAEYMKDLHARAQGELTAMYDKNKEQNITTADLIEHFKNTDKPFTYMSKNGMHWVIDNHEYYYSVDNIDGSRHYEFAKVFDDDNELPSWFLDNNIAKLLGDEKLPQKTFKSSVEKEWEKADREAEKRAREDEIEYQDENGNWIKTKAGNIFDNLEKIQKQREATHKEIEQFKAKYKSKRLQNKRR